MKKQKTAYKDIGLPERIKYFVAGTGPGGSGIFNLRPTGHEDRRRMKTEEKAKVVASVWGERIYSIPCRASCFALDDLNYRMNCTRMI